MNIIFSGTYDRKVLLEWIKIHNTRSKIVVYTRVVLIAFVMVAYAIYLLAYRSNDPLTELGLLLPVTMILYLLARRFILPYETITKVTITKVMKDEDVVKPISGVATDEKLVWTTSTVTSEIKWYVFKDVEIRHDLIMFYQDNNFYTLIPKSFLRSENDWNDLLSFARSKSRVGWRDDQAAS